MVEGRRFKKISEDSEKLLNGQITPYEVENIMKCLPHKSSPGTDGLNYKAWSLLPKYGELLSYIFNTLLTHGKLPKEECVAKIVLLFKKGDENDIKNWRPISLQQSLTKIFMKKVIQHRMIKVLERDKITSNMQKGFLWNNGCLEHVQSLSIVLGDSRRNRKNIFGVFYDVQNAFGTVPQDLIFEVLKLHGFPRMMINAVKSYYGRDVTIITNGKIVIDMLKQEVGVKQSCPLSPLLFILTLDPVLRVIERERQIVTLSKG